MYTLKIYGNNNYLINFWFFAFAVCNVLVRVDRTARLAETRRHGDWRRGCVRHVPYQGQDTRVHVERGTTATANELRGGRGRLVQKRRHVRPADRKFVGPVVAGKPERRSRRGRGHHQE